VGGDYVQDQKVWKCRKEQAEGDLGGTRQFTRGTREGKSGSKTLWGKGKKGRNYVAVCTSTGDISGRKAEGG